MCILLCTKSIPGYKLVLASNRDEFLSRPTARAQFVDDKVLMPRDLVRNGTWIGITRKGRFCVLVNYRESGPFSGLKSRGAIPVDFLFNENNDDIVTWIEGEKKKTNNFKDVGGFSLIVGDLSKDTNMFIFSNRHEGLYDPFKDGRKSVGLSNSAVMNPWPKVKLGEKLLTNYADKCNGVVPDENELINALIDILSHQTIEGGELYSVLDGNGSNTVQETIFVPALVNENGPGYGTRTQTLVMVTDEDEIIYVERDVDLNERQIQRFFIEK